MFVYTFKFNKKLALIIILAIAVLICGIILLIGKSDSGGEPAPAESQTVSNNKDRVSYLESLGWQVSSEPLNEKTIIIPKQFSDVYQEYNKLQLSCGYDLSQYCGLEATVYTYAVKNYKDYSGDVVADLYVRSSKLIGGDIHSLSLDGFMHGLVAAK